jgi:hypothetical protein
MSAGLFVGILAMLYGKMPGVFKEQPRFSRMRWIDVSWDLVHAELLTNPHNIVMIGCVSFIGFLGIWFTRVSGLWILSFGASAIALVFFPLTCSVDDIMIKTALASYAIILSFGFVASQCSAKLLVIPLLIVVLFVSHFFYDMPDVA